MHKKSGSKMKTASFITHFCQHKQPSPQPVHNKKKRAPMDWDEIDAYVRARYDEKWDPAWVAKDLADDPSNRKRGGDAAP